MHKMHDRSTMCAYNCKAIAHHTTRRELTCALDQRKAKLDADLEKTPSLRQREISMSANMAVAASAAEVPIPLPLPNDDSMLEDEHLHDHEGGASIQPRPRQPSRANVADIPVPEGDDSYYDEHDTEPSLADPNGHTNGASRSVRSLVTIDREPRHASNGGTRHSPTKRGPKPKKGTTAPSRRNEPRARASAPAAPTSTLPRDPKAPPGAQTEPAEGDASQGPIVLGNLRFIENLDASGGQARQAKPPTLQRQRYEQECIDAAIASRLLPDVASKAEKVSFGKALSAGDWTTYFTCRNAILRLWHRNPMLWLGEREAKGVAEDDAYLKLCSATWEFLLRAGYINFGCVTLPQGGPPPRASTRERTIVVVGAGVAGLSAARHLQAMIRQFESRLPCRYKVKIVEARGRIGGRVYSHQLSNGGPGNRIDLGAQIVTGFSGGNPLNVVLRQQLRTPYHSLTQARNDLIHDASGRPFPRSIDDKAQGVFNLLLELAAKFRTNDLQDTTDKDVKLAPHADKLLGVAKTTGSKPSEDVAGDPLATLRQLGFEIHPDASMPTVEEGPSLGATMTNALQAVETVITLTEHERSLLAWQWANMEYACGTNLDNLSLRHWDQDDGNEFEGHHAMVIGGYSQLARGLAIAPTSLDIQTGAPVARVTDGGVLLADGEAISADRVIVTVPLGVLKEESIEFDPPLPDWKRKAIDQLGFGLLNKVVLVYDRQFWADDIDMIGHCPVLGERASADGRGRFYMFWNCTQTASRPTLVALMAGNAALACENELETTLAAEACDILQAIHSSKGSLPKPREVIVTRWGRDPYARGSYSYIGQQGSGEDYDDMGRPVGDRLFFAGEACCRTHPSTVHGAYLSGLAAAKQVFDAIAGPQRVIAGGREPLLPSAVRANPDLTPRSRSKKRTRAVADLSENHSGDERESSDVRATPVKKRASAKASASSSRAEAAAGTAARNASLRGILRLPAGDVQFDAIKTRLQELERQREGRVEREIGHRVDADVGTRLPAPHKPRLNPYLVYVKDAWDECRQVADEEERARLRKDGASADALAAAKAGKNHIRAVVGRMWRELTDAGKKRWVDLMDVMKDNYETALKDWKDACRGWDDRAAQLQAEADVVVQRELRTLAGSTKEGDGNDSDESNADDDGDDGQYVTFEEARLRRALASVRAERRRKPRKSDALPGSESADSKT